MKSISLGNRIQKVDIIKHNGSQKQKWVMLSFFGNETHIIRFKRTNLCTAYRTKCTIQQPF